MPTILDQIASLNDPDEWEEGDKPLQESSYATYLKVVSLLNPSRQPGFGLSSTGNLIAAWTVGRDRLTIEFLPNDRVKWVIAQYKDNEVTRFAGQTIVTESFYSTLLANQEQLGRCFERVSHA